MNDTNEAEAEADTEAESGVDIDDETGVDIDDETGVDIDDETGVVTEAESGVDTGPDPLADTPLTDGGETGIVPPDDETPTWLERKERTQALGRLTYEYFERARREDQDLREESTYVERDVLGFPAWPHEMIRNLAITSFITGMTIFLASALPPHIGAPANPSSTPAVILPDWYLYWSFGLLKLGPFNPELAVLGGDQLMKDRTFGVVMNIVVVSAIAVVPFINKGSARRPVEQPFWAAVGVGGVVYAFTISAYSVKNLVPIDSHILFDITHLLPVVAACLAYAVLRSMREGYMYQLNRRYYRLRPPK